MFEATLSDEEEYQPQPTQIVPEDMISDHIELPARQNAVDGYSFFYKSFFIKNFNFTYFFFLKGSKTK